MINVISLKNNWKCQMCGDCCKYWTIYINKDEYNNLKEILKEKKDLIIPHEDRYKINLNENNDYLCPFNNNKMCIIHKEHGEENLPSVCRTFPRQYVQIDNIAYEGLDLSCSSYVKSILFDDIKFNVYQTENLNGYIVHKLKNDRLNKILFDLNISIVNILKSEDLTLKEKLILIIFIYNEINNIINLQISKKKKEEIINNKISEIEQVIINGSLLNEINKIKTDYNLLYEYNILFITNMKKYFLPQNCINRFNNIFNKEIKENVDTFKNYLLEIENNKKMNKIISNVIINILFHEKFITKNIEKRIKQLISYYANLKFLLALNENLNEEEIVNTVKALFTIIYHRENIINSIPQLNLSKDLTSLYLLI